MSNEYVLIVYGDGVSTGLGIKPEARGPYPSREAALAAADQYDGGWWALPLTPP